MIWKLVAGILLHKDTYPSNNGYHISTGMSLENQVVTMQRVTLGLSIHRPEMIPIIAESMKQHDAIFLEEPSVENFSQMLRGKISIDKYLMQLDIEYPEFSKGMCCMLRKLHGQGKKNINPAILKPA